MLKAEGSNGEGMPALRKESAKQGCSCKAVESGLLRSESIKVTVFWNSTPYNLVILYEHQRNLLPIFSIIESSHLFTLMMEVACPPETLVRIDKTTRPHI
jgi:hypothetical protein